MAGGLCPQECQGNVEFEGVSFAYRSRPGQQVLSGVSFSVAAGQTVALVGKSGAGKSTCVALIERFYDPTEGVVLVDGNPMKRLCPKWLRSKLALVSQEPVLFSTTLFDNITYGLDDDQLAQLERGNGVEAAVEEAA
eukprot:CAMPEP_0204352410 /NCGR_PEP_ID=MMETSP0469-20131031/31868_1 /ASSEMBLY_ACC=CAM_ASM_000384 /TAXON_ID=2969 /ORGANISM="Oxyrrhis marina" /LENGTH=136 /DNA_ID=CAMNT_0051339137 /DNA_START=30 /DNA_END=436 /DNA_ORIENTATION=+